MLFSQYVSDKHYECGDIIFNTSTSKGMINNVDYDGDGLYENNLECTWTIITEQNNIVQLFIFEFDLEEDDWCRFDKLKVQLCELTDQLIIKTTVEVNSMINNVF